MIFADCYFFVRQNNNRKSSVRSNRDYHEYLTISHTELCARLISISSHLVDAQAIKSALCSSLYYKNI